MPLRCRVFAYSKAFNTISGDALACTSLSRTDLPSERSTPCSFQMPFSFAVWQGHDSCSRLTSVSHNGWDRVAPSSCWEVIPDCWPVAIWTMKRGVKPASEVTHWWSALLRCTKVDARDQSRLAEAVISTSPVRLWKTLQRPCWSHSLSWVTQGETGFCVVSSSMERPVCQGAGTFSQLPGEWAWTRFQPQSGLQVTVSQ